MENIFFESWQGIIRILIIGVISYIFLIALLRVSGKRSLSKLSAFDMIITFALGSTLSTVILDKKTVLAEGLTALGLLVGLQLCVAWLSVHVARVKDIVRSEPTLLLHHGVFCRAAMEDARVTEHEVLQALRSHGVEAPENAQSVVLETNGSFSVVPKR